MGKLIRADLCRLVRKPLAWITVLYALGSGFIGGRDLEGFGMDNIYLFYLYLLIAVVIVWSVGQKHEERAFGNEIIAGHTRWRILLSQTILYSAFSAAVMLMFVFGCGVGGARYLSQVPAAALLSMGLGLILSCVFYAALVTVIACLISSRATSAVVCFAVLLVLLGGVYEIHHLLKLDRWQDPTGPRALWKPLCVALDFGTPFGQIEYHRDHLAYYMEGHRTLDAARLGQLQIDSWLSSVFAAGGTVLTAVIGLICFKRKDLS